MLAVVERSRPATASTYSNPPHSAQGDHLGSRPRNHLPQQLPHPSNQTAAQSMPWPVSTPTSDHAVGKPFFPPSLQQSNGKPSLRVPFAITGGNHVQQQCSPAPRSVVPAMIQPVQQQRQQQFVQPASRIPQPPQNPGADHETIMAASILMSVGSTHAAAQATGAIRRKHLRIDTSPLVSKKTFVPIVQDSHLPTPSQTPSQSPRRMSLPGFAVPFIGCVKPATPPSPDRGSDATVSVIDAPAPAPVAPVVVDPRRRLSALLDAERASLTRSHSKGWMEYEDGTDLEEEAERRPYRPYSKVKRAAAAVKREVPLAVDVMPSPKRVRLSITGRPVSDTASNVVPAALPFEPVRHRALASPPASVDTDDVDGDYSNSRTIKAHRRPSISTASDSSSAISSKKRPRASSSASPDSDTGANVKSPAPRKSDKMPTLPKEVDMRLYSDTSKAQVVQWPKGGPMTLPADTPMLDALTREEATLCRTMRLMPELYLQIKNAVIGGTYTRAPFRKKEVRGWFTIDVNKINKLYDWFLDLKWIPSEDKEWEARREWLTSVGGGVSA